MARRKMPTKPVTPQSVKTEEGPIYDKTPIAKEDIRTKVKVVSDVSKLRLRSGNSTSADVIELLDPGTELNVIVNGPDWTKVEYKGKTGYVMTKFVE